MNPIRRDARKPNSRCLYIDIYTYTYTHMYACIFKATALGGLVGKLTGTPPSSVCYADTKTSFQPFLTATESGLRLRLRLLCHGEQRLTRHISVKVGEPRNGGFPLKLPEPTFKLGTLLDLHSFHKLVSLGCFVADFG